MAYLRDRRAFGNIGTRKFRGARFGDALSPRFSGLLDQYGGAAAAYSLRALSSGWLAGDVVEVRPSSGAAAQSFTAGQITSGAMLDFVASPGARALYGSTMYWEGNSDDRVEIPFSTSFFSGGNTITVNATCLSEGSGSRYYEVGGVGSGQQLRLLRGGFVGGVAPVIFRHRFSTSGDAIWTTVETPILTGVEHEISVTYNNNSVSNDPVIVVDGVTMTLTESVAPVGIAATADTGLILGNSESFTSALEGVIRNVTVGTSTYDGDGNTNADWLDTSVSSNDGVVGGTPALFTGQGLDGFVSTWYDQSGNANNATQTTTTAQPKIVSAGTLVVGGLDFDGVDDFIDTASPVLTVGTLSVFSKASIDADETIKGFWSEQDTIVDNARIVGYIDTRTTTKRHTNYSPDQTPRYVDLTSKLAPLTEYQFTSISDGANIEGWIDGSSQGNIAITGTFTNATTFEIGRQKAGSLYLNGKVNTIIAYDSDQTANRAAIEALI